MPPSLSKKFAGLPRWAWLAILAGGLTVGLVLRSRSNALDATEPDSQEADGLDDGSQAATDSYDPNSFDNYGGTIPYPPGSGGSSTTFVTPPTPDPRIPCTSPPPSVNVEGYRWVCQKGYWEMTPNPKGGSPCTAPPPSKPPAGFQWKCAGGYWQLEATHAGPPPKNGKVPCASKPPPYKPPPNYIWKCDKDGFWGLVAKQKRGGGGHHKPPHDRPHCHGKPRPAHDPRKGFHWHCVNGRWRQVKDNKNDGRRVPAVVTGGGAPITRDVHLPGATNTIAGR